MVKNITTALTTAVVFVGATAAVTATAAPIAPPSVSLGCAKDATGHLLATGYPKNVMAANNRLTIPTTAESRQGMTKRDWCLSQCANKGTMFAALGISSLVDEPGDICSCGSLYNADTDGTDAQNCKPTGPETYCNGDDGASNEGVLCGNKGFSAVYRIDIVKPCPADSNYVYMAPYQQDGGANPLSRFCYRFEGSTSLAANWTAARQTCEAEGGTLAYVNTLPENNFILSIPSALNVANIGADFWIGGIYYGPTNGFEWSNGRMATFFDWRENEPAQSSTPGQPTCLDVSSATPTPVWGSWAARACTRPRRFMCKKFANSSDNDGVVPPPRVQAVSIGTQTACVAADKVPHLSSSPHLEGWFGFEKASIIAETNTAIESGPYGRNATFRIYNQEDQSIPYNYVFDHNELTHGDSLVFDGNIAAVMPTGWEINSTDTMSVTAWVKPSNQSDGIRPISVIASKAYDNENANHFAWALFIANNTQYCFSVGARVACTDPRAGLVQFGQWAFVTGSYDGRTVAIYVNSAQAGIINGNQVPIIHNRSTPIVIGGTHYTGEPTDFSSRVTFMGALDDVRIYSSALAIGDLEYLETCALLPPTSKRNVATAYANTDTFLVILGHELRNRVHRIGLSQNGCDNVPFTEGFEPIFMQGYMSSTRLTALIPARQIVSGEYELCYTSPNSPSAYEGSINVRLRVTQIVSFAGGKKKYDVDTDTADGDFISAKVEIDGVNLHNMTAVVLSPFRSCQYRFASTVAHLTEASEDGTKAFLIVHHASVNIEFYYICWAGSFEDATTLSNVVATDLILELVGARYKSKAVAYNDGTTRVDREAIQTGFAIDRPGGVTNFFVSCESLSDVNDNYYFKMEMGDFTDFIIPAPNRTACDTLLGATWINEDTLYNAAFYTPFDPSTILYDAQYTRPIPRAGLGSLGGSAPGFLEDGREQLMRWGSDMAMIGSNTVGGCCQSKVHQEPTWGLPYRITGYLFDPLGVYFQMDEVPIVVFPTEIVSIRLRFVDIRGMGHNWGTRKIPGGCNFKVTHTWPAPTAENPDATQQAEYNEFSANCDHVFRTALNAATANFAVEGSLATPDQAGGHTVKNWARGNFSVRTTALPYDSTLLNSGKNITKMLSFRAPGGIDSVIYSTMSSSVLLSMFEPSDALIAPQEEQPMTAFDYHRAPVAKYEWSWRPATSLDELWGGSVKGSGGIQYFAFAFYTAVAQNVGFNGGCRAFTQLTRDQGGQCIMYVSGRELQGQEMKVTSGWHQVVIKLINKMPLAETQGFWLNMDGNGLAFNYDRPLGAPEGSTIIYQDGILEEFMTFGANPIVANSFDEGSTVLPNGVPENQAFPQQDGDWWPYSTPVDGPYVYSLDTMTKYQIAISYFGSAIYATSTGTVTFAIPNAIGNVRVYHNGILVANHPADANGPTRVFTLNLREGWSQLFFKVSCPAGKSWNVKIVATNIQGAVIFNEAAVPERLPEGVVSFAARPVGQVLALLSQGSTEYGLPFDSTSTTDPAAVDPSYTQVNISASNKRGDPETVDGIPFLWTQFETRDETTGYIGESRVDGGGYNRYYNFAMYVSRPASFLNISIEHYEGIGVYFDGQYVGGRVSDSTDPLGTPITLINVTRGMHTVHIRLQAENSLEFDQIAMADHGAARSTCIQKGLTLCHFTRDICPFMKPRVDIGLPVGTTSHFAAVEDGSKWVQVGSGERGVCSIVDGDDAFRRNDGVERTFHAACCGKVRPSYFRFAVTGAPRRTLVGWAAAVPAPAIPRPTITYDKSTTSRWMLDVNISHPDPAAQLFYSDDRAVYPNRPVNGIFEGRPNTFIRAIARVNGKDSTITEVVLRYAMNISISRNACTRGPDCFVQFSNPTDSSTLYTNMRAVAVDTSAPESAEILTKVLASSNYVADADPATASFTNFIAVDHNNVFKIPQAFMTRRGLSQITVVLFESGDSTRDTAGTLIQRTITVAPFAPFYTQAYRDLEYAPVSVTGSFVGGDRIAFPELLMTDDEWHQTFPDSPVCSREACDAISRYEANRVPSANDVPLFHVVNFQGEDSFFLNTTRRHAQARQNITCACVESRGGLTLARNQYINYAFAGLVRFSGADQRQIDLVDLPQPDATKNTAIYSFGPSVVASRHLHDDSAPYSRDNRIYIQGNFPTQNAADYAITFECGKNVTYVTTRVAFNCSDVVPTATIKTVTADKMEVHVHAENNGLNLAGLWTLRLVRKVDGQEVIPNVPLNYAKNFFVAVLPPNPVVTAAEGDCARDSMKCVNGALISFNGYNFNELDYRRNKIELVDSVTRAISKDVMCWVVSATNSSITCSLFFTSDAYKSNALKVAVHVRVEAIPAPRNAGEVFASAFHDTLNGIEIGTPGARGWSGQLGPGPGPTPAPTPTAPTTQPSPADGGSSKDGDSGINVGVIAAVVCGGVLLLVIIGAVFVVTKYDLIPKARKSHDLDDHHENLNVAQEEVA